MRMSRRNTRQGKARRRAERDGRQVSAANSAARKRPGASDQGPRAVEDQAVQAAPRPGGPDSDEHGSGLRPDADRLIAVDLDGADLDIDADLENADPGYFGDLDTDVAGELDAHDVDGPDGPDGPEEPGESEPDRPSAEADHPAEGPGAAGGRVV